MSIMYNTLPDRNRSDLHGVFIAMCYTYDFIEFMYEYR